MELRNQKQAESKIWDKVLAVRNANRIKSKEIIEKVFDSFFELHGDRYYGDDKAIIGGIASINRKSVTVIAQYKGDSLMEQKERQYGMSMPFGYRKALRLMKQAEKFNRPVICLIDTPGAFPGAEAERVGQAEAIARNLYEMSLLKVPVISIIIGEGGSGGALALGVANKLIMLENAVFSVVSPEGCASILWHDSRMAPKAAQSLKISAQDLKKLGIIDKIIPESDSTTALCDKIKRQIEMCLKEMEQKSGVVLQNERFVKYQNIGIGRCEKGE